MDYSGYLPFHIIAKPRFVSGPDAGESLNHEKPEHYFCFARNESAALQKFTDSQNTRENRVISYSYTIESGHRVGDGIGLGNDGSLDAADLVEGVFAI